MSFLLEDKTIEIPYEQLGYNADIKTAVERAYDVGRTGNVFIDYINIVTPFYQKKYNIK